jgi:hypothetical protein
MKPRSPDGNSRSGGLLLVDRFDQRDLYTGLRSMAVPSRFANDVAERFRKVAGHAARPNVEHAGRCAPNVIPLDGHTVLLNPALIVVLDFQDFAQTDCKSTRSVLTNSKTFDPH